VSQPFDQGGERPSLLVVDDTPANLNLLAGLLNTEFRVRLATGGARALELAKRHLPDLVLLDVMMPDIDGYEVCRQLKRDSRTRDIPVIFITALTQAEDEARGFEVGGADFIQKPIRPPTLRARVRTHLRVKAWENMLSQRTVGLAAELPKRLHQVELLRDATLFVVASMAEYRHEDTGNHVKRAQEYVRVLAEHLMAHPGEDAVAARLDVAAVELLAKSAPLHDIGEVAIPGGILLQPGRLDAESFKVMKTHCLHGWEMLRRAAKRMGGDATCLNFAMEIARHHHERWDGTGYPDGLAGRAIPFSARLMAVADVYDALINQRPYKDPLPHDEAMRRLVAGAGSQFDPAVVDAMLACEQRFIDIARTWRN
jgi:putative two-component system response regulator